LATQAQTLYKCVQASGRVQYQQEPCVDAKKQSTVRPPDRVAPRSEPAPAEAREAAREAPAKPAPPRRASQEDPVVEMMADVSACGALMPDFDTKHGAAVAQWNRANAASLARYRNDDGALSRASARAAEQRERLAAESSPNAIVVHCERVANRLRTGGAK